MINQPFSFRTLPSGVKGLIMANGAAFLFQVGLGERLVALLGLSPARVIQDLWLWQMLTYMFLHGGVFHLLLNMYILWSFGREIENRWGTGQFLWYYFLCGEGAAVLDVLLRPESLTPTIGSSGAIYGLLVAFAILFPQAILYLYFLIPLRARQVVMLFAAIEFLVSFSGTSSRVANLAHLGGMLTGFLYLKSPLLWDAFERGMLRLKSFQKSPKPPPAPPAIHDLDQEVDRILDKILKKGLPSLTAQERAFMDRYSRTKTSREG